MNKITSTYLFIAGLVLIAVGTYISFTPSIYLAQFNVNTGINQEMLSELRGMGGMIFVFGVFILSACFKKILQPVAFIITVLIFIAFSLFRSISILVDGLPNEAILAALSVELILAIVGLFIGFKSNQLTTNVGINPHL